MGGKRSAWWTGCGIGCGVILLLVIGIVVLTAVFVRDSVRGFDTAVENRAALEERFGSPGDYVPPPDGAIPAERMELFLRVREGTASVRETVGETFGSFDIPDERARELEEASFWERLRFVGGMSRNAFGLAGELGGFFEARNHALLDAEMGLGEYTYIYVLAYYSWLGHAPADGMPGTRVHVEPDGDAPPVTAGVRSMRRLSRRAHGDLIDMLRGQLGAVDRAPDPMPSAEWRDVLAAEIAALQEDRFRVPWQEGLPAQIEASLEPYRQRLEATYDPLTDEFELQRVTKRGMSIQAE
jgi:hypothetical protein